MAEDAKQKKKEEEPKKEKKLSLPILIGIGAGALIIMVVVIIFALNFILDSKLQKIEEMTANQPAATEHSEKPPKGHDDEHPEDPEHEDIQKFLKGDEAEYYETDQIVTNPLGSTSQFVALRLGLSYFIKGHGEEGGEGGGDGHGDEEGADISGLNAPKYKKFKSRIKHTVNSAIGSMTVTDMQIPRDSLANIIKVQLDPLFKENDFYLKDVILVQFVIQ